MSLLEEPASKYNLVLVRLSSVHLEFAVCFADLCDFRIPSSCYVSSAPDLGSGALLLKLIRH
jgi:hypothetical protein